MFAYIAGVMILLLLWGAGLQVPMAALVRRRRLMPAQVVLSWLIVLAVGYLLTVGLTEFVLPHSRLVSSWTREQMQATSQWSHVLNLVLVAALLARVYLGVQPAPVKAQVAARGVGKEAAGKSPAKKR
jgi:hypothetical protein